MEALLLPLPDLVTRTVLVVVDILASSVLVIALEGVVFLTLVALN